MDNSDFEGRAPKNRDTIGRRGLLECMAWSGAGLVWTMSGGVASSALAGESVSSSGLFTFVQISDSHIGFKKPANPDPVATLRDTVAKIRNLANRPSFVLHTGDITHLATPEQFDLAQSVLNELGVPVRYVPGEHDIADGTNPRPYLDRFGAGTRGDGWYSFDAGGVHFIGLNSVCIWPTRVWDRWAMISWSGSKKISPPSPPPHPLLCSRIFRCGRFIRTGVGEQLTASSHSRCCAGSDLSPS